MTRRTPAPRRTMRADVAIRRKAISHAVTAWREGRPHRAVEILLADGITHEEVDKIIRGLARRSRRDYEARMTRYQAG